MGLLHLFGQFQVGVLAVCSDELTLGDRGHFRSFQSGPTVIPAPPAPPPDALLPAIRGANAGSFVNSFFSSSSVVAESLPAVSSTATVGFVDTIQAVQLEFQHWLSPRDDLQALPVDMKSPVVDEARVKRGNKISADAGA